MASSKTIHDSLIASVQAQNPTIDTVKGPIYDLLLRPVPDEIAGPSADIDNLRTLYSPLIATNSDNNAAIDTLGRAFRVPKPTGQRARTSLVFWFTSVPQQAIVIPAGTAVATQDRSVVYTTVSDIQGINAQTAYGYYNSSTGRYEVYVDAVATQDGQDFEVPASRLTLLLSRVAGISGVYNPVPGTGGISAGNYESYLTRIQTKFIGRDSNSFISYAQRAVELYPDVITSFITSNDRRSFRRNLRGDGFDVVVGTANPTTTEETFQVNNSRTFTPVRQPVLGVLDVYLNGSRITDYTVNIDTSPETSNSAKAMNTVSINTTRKLSTSDTLRIRHTYCGYCYGLQNQLFLGSSDDFFGFDALVRLAVQTEIVVSLRVQIASVNADFQSSLNAFVIGYINSLGFVNSLDVKSLLDAIYTTYTEVRSVATQSFRRYSNANSEVEVIDFAGYEVPHLLTSNIQIIVVG